MEWFYEWKPLNQITKTVHISNLPEGLKINSMKCVTSMRQIQFKIQFNKLLLLSNWMKQQRKEVSERERQAENDEKTKSSRTKTIGWQCVFMNGTWKGNNPKSVNEIVKILWFSVSTHPYTLDGITLCDGYTLPESQWNENET